MPTNTREEAKAQEPMCPAPAAPSQLIALSKAEDDVDGRTTSPRRRSVRPRAPNRPSPPREATPLESVTVIERIPPANRSPRRRRTGTVPIRPQLQGFVRSDGSRSSGTHTPERRHPCPSNTDPVHASPAPTTFPGPYRRRPYARPSRPLPFRTTRSCTTRSSAQPPRPGSFAPGQGVGSADPYRPGLGETSRPCRYAERG